MMYKNDNKMNSSSDAMILRKIGLFIRKTRLENNKSQSKLAEESGISRSTLVELEKGNRSNTITLIQILRALNKLNVLDQFKIEKRISPIKLAEQEREERKRASKIKQKKVKNKSEW